MFLIEHVDAAYDKNTVVEIIKLVTYLFVQYFVHEYSSGYYLKINENF